MEYDSICYIKSCLAQVIIRLDFLEFIEDSVLTDPLMEKQILKNFPKKGMRQIVRYQTMNVSDGPEGAKAEKTTRDGSQQEFVDAVGNKIIISNKYIIAEINKYTNYENVLIVFTPILKKLIDITKLTSMRTGIRYINFFNEEIFKPQKNFFVPEVGALLDITQRNTGCIRSMALNEYQFDDMHLNFRYGMYNPQYPQYIKKLDFVLDYDCFCDDAVLGFDRMIAHIQKGHDNIQNMFENSITDKLRKVMNNG